MANDLIVRILGDTKGLERSFARANQATATFGRNVETTGAKVDKTTKQFGAFARGATTGFIGAAVIAELRSFVDQAAESEQVLGQTRVALETTGKSWERYGSLIEETVQKQSQLGFDDEALLRTFSLFVRTTGEVGEALRLNNLAMDVARARFIDLEQAAQLVNKAAIGQGGALRRLGIDVKANASATELLIALQEKYGGAAEAASDDASTAFDRTKVATENLQESIGTLLLPALELLAANMQVAAEFATNLTDALRKIGAVTIPEIEIPFNITIGGQTVGDLAGKAFGVAKFIGPFLPIAVANRIAQEFRDGTEDPAVVNELANSFARSINTLTTDALDIAAGQVDKAKTKIPSFGDAGFKPLPENTLGDDLERQFNDTLAALDLRLDKAAVTKGIADDLAVLAEMQKLIRQRIATHGKTTDLMRLLFQVDQQRAAVIKGQAAEAAAARAETKRQIEVAAAKRREIAETAARALQESQFRALGLDKSGGEIIPGAANLGKRITQTLAKVSAGQLQISGKLASRLRAAAKLIRKEGKNLTDATRETINGFIKEATSSVDKATGPLTRTSSLNADKILEGLGLTPEMEREARARLSSFNSAGRSLAGATRPTGNFAPQTVDVTVNSTTTLDGEVVSRNTSKHQQKTKRRNPRQKRGPNSRSGI